MDGATEKLPDDAGKVPRVLAASNGHHWIKFRSLVCCRDCGIVRRADDRNKPCKGVVKIGLRG
jgi:hypothetical protein